MDEWEALLRAGNWPGFYRAFEKRFEYFPELKRQFDQYPPERQWTGQFTGRLAVVSEQGIGDGLQFWRYLPFAKDRCTELILCSVGAGLCPLAEEQAYVDAVSTRQLPKHYDHWIGLLSLPALLRLEECPTRPYITAPQEVSIDKGKKNIGLAWAGNAHFGNDINRSIPLKQFAPLFERADLRHWCLQVDKRKRGYKKGEETIVCDLAEHPEEWEIIDLGPHMVDWLVTAKMVQALDVVVCADTSLLHLSAALGVRTIGLLPHKTCWRWGYDWYETLTLCKQDAPGDWDSCLRKAVALC